MKPRMLKIKGLNSFIEEQEIDFCKLTGRGLFGIFGPTGSGKSTILDAITLALYGEIPRNTKEFVNTEVDTLNVSYEFSIKDGENINIYIVERNFKKTEEGIRKSRSARLLLIDRENIDIIAEGINNVTQKINEILGLGAEDFTRSVVLPQGKFNEFLKLTGADRRNMLERIFGLKRYGKGLTEKIKIIKNKKSMEILDIESQLKVYGNLTKEEYEEQKKNYEILVLEEERLKSELEIINKKYEKYQGIWELQQELEIYQNKQKDLNGKKDEYNKKKQILSRAKDAEIIKPQIEELREIEKKKSENENTLKTLNDTLQNIIKEKERIEAEYLEALNNKNINHPILLQKETNLNQALKMLEDKISMKKERDNLREVYKENKKEIEEDEAKENELKNKIENLEKRANEIERAKQKIHIEPHIREEIQKGYELEREYFNLEKENNETEEKLEKIHSQILESTKKYNALSKEKEEESVILQKLNEGLINLRKNCPGSNDDILSKHKYLEELKTNIRDLDENIRQKTIKEDRLKDTFIIVKEGEGLKEKLFAELGEIKKKQEKLKDMLEGIKRKNMAAILARELKEGQSCPVCGSTNHIPMEFELDEEKYNNMVIEEKKLENSLREIETSYHKISLEHTQMKKEVLQTQAEIDRINVIIEDKNIDTLKSILIKEEESLKLLQETIKKWESSILENESNLSISKEKVNNIEKEEARLKERLNNDKDNYKELKEKWQKTAVKLEEVLSHYNKIKNKYNLNKIEDRINEIKEWDKLKAALEKEEKELRENIKIKIIKKDELTKLISELTKENEKTKQSGIEKTTMIEKWDEQIINLSGKKEPYSHREEIRNKIKGILKEEETLRHSFEKIKKEIQGVEEEVIKLKAYNQTLNQLKQEQENKITLLLKEYKLLDCDEVYSHWLPQMEREALKEEISEYEKALDEIKNNLFRIQSKLKEDVISKEAWEDLKVEKREKVSDLERRSKYIAVIHEKLNIMKQNLESIVELNDKKAVLDRTFSLLEDLYRLVQGNKFVEFAAYNRLRYIAKEASKTLKEITRGRYALELDGDGNFIMRDDFNGGIRRSATTLSGGETFLTSLSLALALSSQIQLNNTSPLEFFFLDEGFGTLDNNLLDIVMGALEKLHSQQLCVGIISHVEELKSRIPIKLIVEPARQGLSGSKVKIEYL
ncbi:MAG: AAA family ATPase [Epulopiscium sp.]|nr:AAA family ATPase [Candidatus Epulonipiscium sp.]